MIGLGKQSYQKGKYLDAKEYFRQAVKPDPFHRGLRCYGHGFLLERGGHPNAGSALLQSISPEDARVWILDLLKGNHNGPVQVSDLMSYPVFPSPLLSV